MRGQEAAQHLCKLAASPALQPLTGAVDQELQVLARVGVQRRQDLIGIDRRVGVGHRNVEALLRHGSLAGSRHELDEHVVEPGLGPQESGGVGVDEILVLVLDVHLHHGDAVLELDVADVPDLHA